MRRIHVVAFVAAALLLPSAAALAQQSNQPEIAPAANAFFGDYRARAIDVSKYPLDAAGRTLGASSYVEHRLRVGGFAKNGPVSVTAEADLVNGLLLGDTSERFPYVTVRRDRYALSNPDIFVRNLFVEAKLPVALVRAGHQANKWGLGIIANDGAGTPDWGDHYYGDEVERVLAATEPLVKVSPIFEPLLLAAGADVVYHDASADLYRGDRAYQGLVSLLWAPPGSDDRAGVYAVRRTQVDREGYSPNAWIVDAHARLTVPVGAFSGHVEAEIARVTGDTNEVRDVFQNSRTIDQLGAAAEIGVGYGFVGAGHGPDEGETFIAANHRYEAVVQAGYASGDDRAFDGRLTAFKFDPEYCVGLVMFREVMAWQSAATAKNVADPNVFGRPAPGARFLTTDGAVTNAKYVMPTVRYSPIAPLTLRAGWLMAQADRPLDDPYQTQALNGGVRHTPLGSTTASLDLGQEVDLGARWTFDTLSAPHVVADLQAGHFMPGAAFVDANGTKMKPVDRILAGLTLSW